MSSIITPEAAVLVENEPFVDIRNAKKEGVTLSADTIDADNSPTTQLRRGLIVGYDAGLDLWIDAADSTVDATAAAVVTASEAADADWASDTITASLPELGISVTVTLGAGDDTNDEVRDALNASAAFAAHFVASVAASRVVITARHKGFRMLVTSSLATAFGASGTANSPTKAKFGILEDPIPSTLGMNGTAVRRRATIITKNAVVRESRLLGLTDDARQYFRENNITFALEA